MGSRSSHARALEQPREVQKQLGGLDKAQNSDLDEDVNSAPDKLVYSARQGVWNGLNGASPTWGFSWAL
ncbi:hypothetical protein SLEP1_g38945 [Rubroshorea leprosula]|uniref:Uncharacterized protein n=1 Tax=Rubroshorea leprosula TaxID=152421 RepID=A0AAV5KZD6_9ROSI|nr:hypothetical protein SLEP1_g38945 [Rubroshorea leprosula]